MEPRGSLARTKVKQRSTRSPRKNPDFEMGATAEFWHRISLSGPEEHTQHDGADSMSGKYNTCKASPRSSTSAP